MGRMIVSWKSSVEGGGMLVGPVWIYDEDDPDVDPEPEWMTCEQAEELARAKGYDFENQDDI